MRASLAIKTLFRTMGKTVFTFILLAVLIFSLFIQLAEYVKTAAEFRENTAMYEGIGYMEYQPAVYKGKNLGQPDYLLADPRMDALNTPEAQDYLLQEFQGDIAYPPLSAADVETIEQLPHVSSVQKRYMTAGVWDRMRMMEDRLRYDYNNRVIVEGTLDRYVGATTDQDGNIRRFFVRLRDAKVLAGDVHIDDLLYPAGTYGSPDPFVEFSIYPYEGSSYDEAFLESLQEGDRFVAVFTFTRRRTNEPAGMGSYWNYTRDSLSLGNWVSDVTCPPLWNITGAPENYLELAEYAPLKQAIDVLEADLYTLDVVYTDDMRAIQRIHDSTLYLKEGRWLTPEDSASGARVCVVDNILATQYNLKLGDTISLKLGHELFEQFYSLGAIACGPQRLSDEWTEDAFEIVGFYTGSTLMKDANEPNWAYSMNTVFVPLSALPLTEDELAGHAFAPGEFSFRVEDPWDIEAFLEESAPQIEDMGLTLQFDDGGWMEVLEGYRDAQKLPLIRIILLAFVTVTGTALSAYLFISRKRKDYAIMRALGTPKRRSGRSLLLPLAALSLAAMLLGVVAGAIYSRAVLGTVPALPVAVCIVGGLASTLLFAGLNIRSLSTLPPLILLQGNRARIRRARRAARKKPAPVVQGTLYTHTDLKLSYEPLPIKRRPASPRFLLDYVWRHLRRQGLKSALSVLLAALLVGAVVQFASLRDTYNGLRETTVVPVKFTRSLSQSILRTLESEGLTKDVYYARTANISCMSGTKYDTVQLVITPDIDRFLGLEYEINLADGYTEADIGKLDHVLVAPKLMEERGIQPGDTIWFATSADFDHALAYYSKIEEDKDYARFYQNALDQTTAEAVVIGTITTESAAYANAVFTAGLDDAQSLVGTYQSMPLIEFTLSDNSRLEEMRQRAEEITHGRAGAFVLDSEALESVIRTSDLLNGLYPAAVALALLIGAALCALLVMQTGKEAAIMRAQGTTKRTTRSMLALEQIILGMLGVLLGLIVMLVWKRAAFAPIAVQAGLFAGAYALVLIFSSYISAAFATRKNILELLQTKE